MKLKLKKSVVKHLSRDDKKLPLDMTPQVAGGDSYTQHPSDACYEVTDGCMTGHDMCDPLPPYDL